MTQALLIDKENNREKRFDTIEQAQEQADELRSLGADVEVKDISSDGGEDVEPAVVEHSENGHADSQKDEEDSETADTEPKEPEVVDNTDEIEPDEIVTAGSMPDPLATVPTWMTTTIEHREGEESVDLNKRGTQVIANTLDYVVDAECEIESYETDFDYARYRATVTTPDGDEFSAVGDAHIKEPGNNRDDLERLAETRAKKRAVKWATGGGLQAFMEESDE